MKEFAESRDQRSGKNWLTSSFILRNTTISGPSAYQTYSVFAGNIAGSMCSSNGCEKASLRISLTIRSRARTLPPKAMRTFPRRNVWNHKPPAVEQMVNEKVRVFFGRRLDCAQCHNHPFDRWTQNQYWGLAAFFGRMNNTGWAFDNAIFDDPKGAEEDYLEATPEIKYRKVAHPRTKQLMAPTFTDGRALRVQELTDVRMELAKWMTSHPYFAEATVNRMWAYFFGRGIVDPVDDFRLTNPPTHPELLTALARDFSDHGYDLKHLFRTIVLSRAYQSSSIPNETNREDRVNFRMRILARLRPKCSSMRYRR